MILRFKIFILSWLLKEGVPPKVSAAIFKTVAQKVEVIDGNEWRKKEVNECKIELPQPKREGE